MSIQLHIIVSGLVQGVGFRYFTKAAADRDGITGWVRNNSNGTVELIAQGTVEALKAFVTEIKKGPRFSKVTDMKITETTKDQDYTTFQVTY